MYLMFLGTFLMMVTQF